MEGCFTRAAGRLAGLAGALLGWAPDTFWRATPAELAAVLGAMLPPQDQHMSASDLSRLMEMFPDEDHGEGPLHRASRGRPPRSGEDKHG